MCEECLEYNVVMHIYQRLLVSVTFLCSYYSCGPISHVFSQCCEGELVSSHTHSYTLCNTYVTTVRYMYVAVINHESRRTRDLLLEMTETQT